MMVNDPDGAFQALMKIILSLRKRKQENAEANPRLPQLLQALIRRFTVSKSPSETRQICLGSDPGFGWNRIQKDFFPHRDKIGKIRSKSL
ncbi:hypothetical protein [Chlorobaculum tepidum]|uniref:hypothetical protein n=1 Tax=Chlorobaculum tepidum TaxID=1097 RepID=UPI0013E8B9C9|nr:hypothetical protein [Chlorobaculum tepidum]